MSFMAFLSFKQEDRASTSKKKCSDLPFVKVIHTQRKRAAILSPNPPLRLQTPCGAGSHKQYNACEVTRRGHAVNTYSAGSLKQKLV